MNTEKTCSKNVTVDSKTTAEGFGTGSVSGSSLWNNKDAIANPNRVSDSIIVVAGDVVYAKKANESAVAIVDGEIYTTMAHYQLCFHRTTNWLNGLNLLFPRYSTM